MWGDSGSLSLLGFCALEDLWEISRTSKSMMLKNCSAKITCTAHGCCLPVIESVNRQKWRWAGGQLRFLRCRNYMHDRGSAPCQRSAPCRAVSVPPASSAALLRIRGGFLCALFSQLAKTSTILSSPGSSTQSSFHFCRLRWALLSLWRTPSQQDQPISRLYSHLS